MDHPVVDELLADAAVGDAVGGRHDGPLDHLARHPPVPVERLLDALGGVLLDHLGHPLGDDRVDVVTLSSTLAISRQEARKFNGLA
jgi:hypothetical protein